MASSTRLAVFLCALSCLAAPVQARTLVFDNFGNKFQSSISGPCVKGPAAAHCGAHGWHGIADVFSPSATGALDHIDIAAGYVSGDRGVVVTLVPDRGGAPSLTDPILESWLVSRAEESTCCSSKLHEVLASTLHPGLAKGSKYWLLIVPLGFDSFSTWQTSPTAKGGFASSADGGTSWQPENGPQPALDVWVH